MALVVDSVHREVGVQVAEALGSRLVHPVLLPAVVDADRLGELARLQQLLDGLALARQHPRQKVPEEYLLGPVRQLHQSQKQVDHDSPLRLGEGELLEGPRQDPSLGAAEDGPEGGLEGELEPPADGVQHRLPEALEVPDPVVLVALLGRDAHWRQQDGPLDARVCGVLDHVAEGDVAAERVTEEDDTLMVVELDDLGEAFHEEAVDLVVLEVLVLGLVGDAHAADLPQHNVGGDQQVLQHVEVHEGGAAEAVADVQSAGAGSGGRQVVGGEGLVAGEGDIVAGVGQGAGGGLEDLQLGPGDELEAAGAGCIVGALTFGGSLGLFHEILV